MTIPSGVNATTRPSALRRRLACLGTLLMLSGCGTNVLHNAADFKAATEADETSKKIDYAAVIRVERTVQAKILEHELSVVNDFAVARRNFALLNLMTAGKPLSENLRDRIANRLKKLTGAQKPTLVNVTLAELLPVGAICGAGLVDPAATDHADPGAWVTALDASLEECADQEFLDADIRYEDSLGFDAPVCPADGNLKAFDNLEDKKREGLISRFKNAHPTTASTDDKIKMFVRDEYNAYRDKCMNVRAHEIAGRNLVEGCRGEVCGTGATAGAVINGLTGELVEARKRVHDARALFLKDKKSAEDAKDAYEAAQDAYKKAAKKHADKPSDATRMGLKEAGEKLGAALELLGNAGGVFGKDLLAEEQIAKIDQIMKAAGTGVYDKEALKKACTTGSKDCALAQATAVAAYLPSFIDRVDFIATLAEAPPLSGLLLEKSRLLALKQRADKAVQRRQRQISLYEENAQAILKEVKLLVDANRHLPAASMTSEDFVSPTTDAAKREKKKLMLRALGKYLLTFSDPKRQAHANEYRLVALEHEGALDHSEASLNIWKAAIEVPMAALLAYHETGLKPKDVVELLKALGLGGVALGVN